MKQLYRQGDWLVSKRGWIRLLRPRFLLNDNFTTDLAAGAVNGTLPEPNGLNRKVRDVEEEIVFSGGYAEFTPQATPVYAEQDLVYDLNPITRANGVLIAGKFRSTADGPFIPLALVTSTIPTWNPTHVEAAFHRAATALSLTAANNGAAGPIVATFVADGTVYYLLMVLDGVGGALFYIKGGTQHTYWNLVYRTITGATATLYAAIAGFSAAFGAKFIRGPIQAILQNPLLSDTFAGTWPTPDVIGGAWLDAGTWALAGGAAVNTPLVRAEMWDAAAAAFTSGTYAWIALGTNTIENDANSLKITYVNDSSGARVYFADSADLNANLVVGMWYRLTFDVKINTGGGVYVRVASGGYSTFTANVASATFITQSLVFKANHATASYINLSGFSAGRILGFDNMSLKQIPISSLVANMQLSTPDVLAEMQGVHTSGLPVGFILADRSFQGLANADAAAGQPVIVLKNLTAAVQVGAIEDTITIKHPIAGGTTYTIASVGALVAGVQTITLDSNLVEAVVADDKVGVDYAYWNGLICTADNNKILVSKCVLGVYTDLTAGGVSYTYSAANKRFMFRKIGGEYRVYYNEALIVTYAAGVVEDAAVLAANYIGMLNADAANTVSLVNAFATGTGGEHSVLDRYARG